MKLDIYRGASVQESVFIDDSSKVIRKVNGEDRAKLSFEHPSVLDITLGDKITVDSRDYFLNSLPPFQKTSSNLYKYDLVFEAEMYDLVKVQYLDSGRSEFFLTGDAEFFIDLLITNANRILSGWTKGSVASTDERNLQFNSESCLQVLQRICQEFNLYFSISSKAISLATSPGSDSGESFEYGQGKGLYSLTRKNVSSKNVITRLYAYGADKNLPGDYRSYSKRLMFADPGSNYLEKNTGTYGIIEHTKIFDHIYPRFKGVITNVQSETNFRCSTIDFDINDYILGIAAKVHFNTGDLAGYDIEILSYDNVNKEIELLKFDDNGLWIPGDLDFGIGDEFVLVDIEMPSSYITSAETDLQTEAQSYLDENADPRVQYSLSVNPKYIKDNSISLSPGDSVTVKDTPLGIDKLVTIQSITQSVADPNRIQLELSDLLTQQLISYLYADQATQRKETRRVDLSQTDGIRREYQRISELDDAIFDPDGYFDTVNIKPLSIETAMLAVGSKSSQFILKDVVLHPNYAGDPADFEVTAGELVHFTIDAAIKVWTLSSNSYSSLTDGTVYYIYARCSRSTTAGQVILDSTQRKVDDGSTYYYFLIGVLHSVDSGVRDISLTYGHTRINGKFITTGVIQSQSGLCKFDLDNNTIEGKVTFKSGTGGYSEISDKPNQLIQINASEGSKLSGIAAGATVNHVYKQTSAPSSGMVSGDLWFDTDDNNKVYRYNGASWETVRDEDIAQALADAADAQATADGKIVSYFQPSAPGGASDGDIWFDTDDDNKVYRYNSGWQLTRDDGIAQAISEAADAQSTADSKIVTFYQSGTPTADGVGDLWYNTNTKEVKRWSGSTWVQYVDGVKLDGIAANADVTDYADYRVSNSEELGSILTIQNPQGANYRGINGDTGVIKITLPQSWTNTMMKFEVDVFEYASTKNSFTVFVGGYTTASSNQWIAEFAQIMGSVLGDNRVRFGHDGSKCCVLIGETDTVWHYPMVVVKKFQAGYSNFELSKWDDGWIISTETDISGVTVTGDISDALLDAKAILGQGALATQDTVDFDTEVIGSGKPASGAQVNAPTIGIKKNIQSWDTANNGEAYIHGFDDDGDPADVDGKFLFNGSFVTIDRTQAGNTYTLATYSTGSGYIIYRTGSTDWFTMYGGIGDFKVAFCKKENGVWYFDNNYEWSLFTPNGEDVVIGTMVCDSPDHIETAHIWSQGMDIDVVSEAAADNTVTIIDGGIVTSGRVELGSGGTVVAGINGYGTAGSEIRIWAGDTYANRAIAPFRVNQDGDVVMESVTLRATNDVTYGAVALDGADLFNPVGNSDNVALFINRIGYDDGQTKYRDLYIQDGKGNSMMKFEAAANNDIFCYARFQSNNAWFQLSNLPTSDPTVNGRLWRSGSQLFISSG